MTSVVQDPPVALPTDCGVLTVVDPVHADALWPEFAYHGTQHGHGHNGVMTMPGGVGLLVDDVTHHLQVTGSMHHTVEVGLRFTRLDGSAPAAVTAGPETVVPWTSDVAWAGDPLSMPSADDEPHRLTSWRWPAPAGLVAVRVLLAVDESPAGAVVAWRPQVDGSTGR